MTGGSTIVFFPEGAYGPTNNCVGIGSVLQKRGARVVFVVEESFAGTLEAKGFEEALMRLKPPPEVPEVPGQFWKDFVRETAPEFRKPTIEQLEGFIKPVFEELIDGAKYVDDRLNEIFDDVQPDVIVEDNVVAFPAVVAAGKPWARILSCNPLELKDPELPPAFSGYPTEDRTDWDEFRARYAGLHADLWKDFNEFCVARSGQALDDLEFMYSSPYLNMYLYPAEADYPRSVTLPGNWHRLDSSVRTTDERWEIPAELGDRGTLVYLSLGSLGSADVGLMNRLTALLGESGNRVVVSMGPQHDEIRLADNMVGAEFLPQTSILPQVDLVITHGGNNTVTEAMHFGKPMIVLPLFWDQYDNAQRMQEIGFGVRLPTYEFEDDELLGAIDRLIADEPLHARIGATAARLQANPGTEQAADLIERLAREKEPVTA
ncbi:MAG: nucleotide disphospho-sugar-binding domain-containing protein [Actinomycetota bacterium]